MMTLRARAMGMSHTTFTNASGLPDDRQLTTARDLAVLARRLVSDFPGDYRYFSTASFTFQGRVIFNHDNMLRSYPGADGMKTGYTEASGHNLVTSAVRGGVRLIGVVLGAGSNAARDVHMAALLNQGFGEMGVAARGARDAGRQPHAEPDRVRARRDAERDACLGGNQAGSGGNRQPCGGRATRAGARERARLGGPGWQLCDRAGRARGRRVGASCRRGRRGSDRRMSPCMASRCGARRWSG